MKDYEEKSMITATEAKKYAMERRFEVAPEKRVRVALGKGDCAPIAWVDVNYGRAEFCEKDIAREKRLEAVEVWDRDGVNRLGRRGCVRQCFDRTDFMALFQNYPK